MSHAVQDRMKVPVTEEKIGRVTIVIPQELLAPGSPKLSIFRCDDLHAKLPPDDHHLLHTLCSGLMPGGCSHVDHAIISRYGKKTKVQIQLSSELSVRARVRIDAALNACDLEPVSY